MLRKEHPIHLDLPRIPTASLGDLSGEGLRYLFTVALKPAEQIPRFAVRCHKSKRGIGRARSERHVVVLKRNREKRRSQESAFQGLLRIEPQKPTQIKSPVSAGLLLK
jgi:hypothetical protein